MSVYHLDFETRSESNLKKVGAYRYAADPSTMILLCALAKEDGEPVLWVHPTFETPLLRTDPAFWLLLRDMDKDWDASIYAHNAQFEAAVTKYRWRQDIGPHAPRLESWRCTKVMARIAAIRNSLAGCAEDLRLEQQKDKEGSRLINKFSKPQKPTPTQAKMGILPYWVEAKDDPADFAAFGSYCLQDVRTEQAIHAKLKAFEMTGPQLEAFKFDLRVNDRGIPVNVDAIHKANAIVKECSGELLARFKELTGLGPNQNVALKKWFQARGYPKDSMDAQNMEEALDDLSWAGDDLVAIEALELRSVLGFASIKKLDAMLKCECGDGYVRGTLNFYGAGTGRWSASLIQPQNYKRPTVKNTHDIYQLICEGINAEGLKMLYGNNVLEMVSSCVRHFIQPHEGNFLDADYAAIEARIVCWLAGQEDALQGYRNKEDAYIKMATRIYGIKESEVDKHQRWMGKQAVLGCGFQMWWPKFQAQCAKYGVHVPDDVAELAVRTFRQVYDKVAQLWEDFDQAARNAIEFPNKWFAAGPHCAFATTQKAGFKYLVLKLPSGRKIVYPDVKIEMVSTQTETVDPITGATVVKNKKKSTITFYGQIKENRWGRVSTYGGKLVENATQGCAADIMGNGAVKAEERGYMIATLIHDQALAFELPGLTLEGFLEALCDLPPWAKGLPIAAEGSIVPFYTKD